jgi:GT2 family glycosyltransferase
LSNKGISVIIPNYNGLRLLPKILPPLFDALIFAGLPYEVIVSDDSSSDDSVSFLQKEFPQVKLIVNKVNKGFSPTANKGIFAAKFDYVLLLNSDVILTENYFIPLLRYFDREDTFGVMGRTIGWDDNIVQESAKFPSFHGAKIKTAVNYLVKPLAESDWLYSMYLSGANAFIDRKKLLELNGFDEIFAPFYVEDFELSLRAWRVGWKCYYDHFAVCRHQTSVTIKSKSSKAFINTIYYRNKMYLHVLHLPALQLFFWYLQLIPELLIRIFTFRFYYVKSLSLFFKNRKKINESKQRFLTLNKSNKKILSVKEVVRTIRESLKQKEVNLF